MSAAAWVTAAASWITTVDHKRIGVLYGVTAFLFFLVGGVEALLIRLQLAGPGGRVVSAETYNALFTMHGTTMVFLAIMPLNAAFFNYMVPLLIGARDVAFPRLNALSYWILLFGGLFLNASFLVGAPPDAGWFGYANLTSKQFTPGPSVDFWLLSLQVLGVSSMLGGINFIVTILNMRAPGMTLMRMPVFVWMTLVVQFLIVLAFPPITVGLIFLMFDRFFGTRFYDVAAGGDLHLWQHLFWIFGHPEVYILILPAWGILGDVIPFFARKPHHWYKGTVWSMVIVTVLSAMVYGHHMFMTGMSPLLGEGFMLFTLLISAPSMVVVLNWVLTLWRGSIRFDTPMLFALATVFVFGVGGLTGLFLADISMDLYLHDTMFVVGHFHFTMAAASFIAAMTGVYFWFPKIFGRKLDERLGKAHFWFTFVGITLVFGGQLLAGYAGQQRRLFDPFQYTFIQGLRGLNRWTSFFAFALFAGQFIFVWNFFRTLFGKAVRAGENPWQVTTLEWTATGSPPPFHNFDRIPEVVRGPHEFSNPEVRRLTGRDFAGQSEVLPGSAGPALAAVRG